MSVAHRGRTTVTDDIHLPAVRIADPAVLLETAPNTDAVLPPSHFEVDADRILGWVATVTGSTGQPLAETDALRSERDLHHRIPILVSQAQTDGVLALPDHHLELWPVADHGFLLTVDPPHSVRLCTQLLSVADLLPD